MDIHTILQFIGDLLSALLFILGGGHFYKLHISNKDKDKPKLKRKERKLILQEYAKSLKKAKKEE